MGKILGTLAIVGLGVVLYNSWKEAKASKDAVKVKK